MDIVKILEDAVDRLPTGEYSTGLNAIVRHAKAAIRHLERGQLDDPDSCTDVIYRTNQAYEGSLKEAYRVLAGKDPSGLSPFQIEQYLETHSVVRPRVLTQLTRYRQDYRNPSTHDYKLDFDEDEALLAIVAVCAFARLLTNQISSKLASHAAQLKATPTRKVPARASLKSQGRRISAIALTYTNASQDVDWFEFERGLAEALSSAGFAARVHDAILEELVWDISVTKGKSKFLIDVRMSRHERTDRALIDLSRSPLLQDSAVGFLTIIRSTGEQQCSLYQYEQDGKNGFVIVSNDPEQLRHLTEQVGELKALS